MFCQYEIMSYLCAVLTNENKIKMKKVLLVFAMLLSFCSVSFAQWQLPTYELNAQEGQTYGSVIDVNSGADFVNRLKGAKSTPVVVMFSAPWSGTAKFFRTIFDKAAERHPELMFLDVNVEEAQDVAGTYKITELPTVCIFKDFIVTFRNDGAMNAANLEMAISENAK